METGNNGNGFNNKTNTLKFLTRKIFLNEKKNSKLCCSI